MSNIAFCDKCPFCGNTVTPNDGYENFQSSIGFCAYIYCDTCKYIIYLDEDGRSLDNLLKIFNKRFKPVK